MKEIKMTRSMWKTLKAKEKLHYLWCGFMVVFMEVLSWVTTVFLILIVNSFIMAVPFALSLLVLRILEGDWFYIALYSYTALVALSTIFTLIRLFSRSKSLETLS